MVDNLVVLKHFLLDVDVSEFSIFRVQDIGSVLLVLDVLFTEDTIEGYGTAESELLSDFCCGVRLADVREDSDALFSIDACLAFFLEGGEELDTEFRVVQNLIDDILGGVDAVLADRRYDITSKSLLERQGCGLIRSGKEKVQTGLGNDEHFLFAAGGSNPIATLPFIRYSLKNGCHVCAGIPQRYGHILRHKPRFTVAFDNANLPKLFFLKQHQFVHQKSARRSLPSGRGS